MNLKRCLHASCRLGLSRVVKNPLKVFIEALVFIVVLVFYILLLDGSGKELASIQKACIRTANNENKEGVFEREISRDTDTADDISNAVKLAKRVSKYNGSVLVSVVNDAFLPFAYSWLCNTKCMNVHKSVLIITTDAISKQRLNTDWPEVNVVKLDLKIPPGNQEFSRAGYLQIMIRRTEMLQELLLADIEILLLEFDFMWFVNPIPHLQRMKGVDFLVNPVSGKVIAFNGGFLYMFPTERSKTLWKKLTEMMHELGEQLENKANNYPISIEHNDQVYFSSLIKQRYANVTTRKLPLDTYADGKWYKLSASDRRSKPTFVISNNFIRAMNLKRCLHASCRLGLSRVVKNPLKVFIEALVFIVVLVFYILLLDGSGKELASIQKACIRTANNENKEGVFEREISRDTDTADDISNAVKLAKRVSKYNGSVLVSVVNDAFLPFAYSWLCNTKCMNVHKSVLIITTDAISKQRLNTDWPEVNVVKLDLKIPPGNQEFSRAGYLQIMIRRTEMLQELLLADIEILLLEFDFMWFVNPIPHLQRMKGVDFLVNPVSGKVIAFNGGFLYMFPTERSKTLWKKLTEMMHELGEQLENKANNYPISIEHNDQVYFSSLIKQRYANVTTRKLPLDTYADGKWYKLSASDRRSKPTFVISNNFIRGNANK